MSKQWYDNNVSEVYYCIYQSTYGNLMTIICVQNFDLYSYEEKNFVYNSNNDLHCFSDEKDAIKMLNKWFKKEEIDPEYINNNIVRDYE